MFSLTAPLLASIIESPDWQESASHVDFGGVSDPGCRSANEDCFLIAELGATLRPVGGSWHVRPRGHDAKSWLFAVADGVGGNNGGAVASSLAIQLVAESFREPAEWLEMSANQTLDSLARLFCSIDSILWHEGRNRPGCFGMGTTLTLALVRDCGICVAHVGDSRCYRIRRGEFERLTRDHTLVEDMVQAGVLDRQSARRHPLRHIVTNCLGSVHFGVNSQVQCVPFDETDGLLVVTDGLTDAIPDDQIVDVLATGGSCQEVSERLLRTALEQGSRDNVTAIVARF